MDGPLHDILKTATDRVHQMPSNNCETDEVDFQFSCTVIQYYFKAVYITVGKKVISII